MWLLATPKVLSSLLLLIVEQKSGNDAVDVRFRRLIRHKGRHTCAFDSRRQIDEITTPNQMSRLLEGLEDLILMPVVAIRVGNPHGAQAATQYFG